MIIKSLFLSSYKYCIRILFFLTKNINFLFIHWLTITAMAKYSLYVVTLLFTFISVSMAVKLQTFKEDEKFVKSLEQQAKFFLPPGTIFPNIAECWRSILKVEGCAANLFISFFTFQLGLSRGCCEAVKEIGEKCFLNIFSNFPFNPQFPPLLEAFCSTIKAPKHSLPPPLAA